VRLRTKFAVGLLAVALVLGAVTVGSVEAFKRQSTAETRADVADTANLTAGRIDSQVRESGDYVGTIGGQPRTANFSRSGAVLGEMLDNSRFRTAQLVAANGTVVDFRGNVRPEVRRRVVGTDVSDRDYVQASLTGRTYYRAPERVAGTDRYILVISAPVFEDTEVVGVLAAALPVNGNTVFDGLRPLESESQTVRVVGQNTSGNSTTLNPARRTFERPITGEATVPATGWTVTVDRERSVLAKRLQSLALVQGGSLLVVLLAVLGFGAWQYNASLRQAERLTRGFDALQRGEYDYDLSLSAADEWDRIGEGYDALATGLREREATIRQREQRLEVLTRVLRHNVRNRMAVVQENTGLLTDFLADDAPPAVADIADSIVDAADDLDGVAEKARLAESVMEHDEGDRLAVDLGRAAREAADAARETYNADVTVDATDGVEALAVPELDTAVTELVENACEHVEEPTVAVTVDRVAAPATDRAGDASTPATDGGIEATGSAEGAGERARVVVADDGPGIPEMEREVLEAGRETDLEHSQGMGLWLVYWIVRQSGGDLTIKTGATGEEGTDPQGTDAPGAGTRVTLSFDMPAAADADRDEGTEG
jgi:signal transduction histidine kinase